MARKVPTVVLLLALFPSATASLSAKQMLLAAANETQILIEDLSPAGSQCNISKDSLDAALRLPVSASKLLIVTKSPDVRSSNVLYANVTVMKEASGICMAAVRLDFSLYIPMFNQRASLWSDGSLMYGPAHNFGLRVANDLEQMTKNFIAAWLKSRMSPPA